MVADFAIKSSKVTTTLFSSPRPFFQPTLLPVINRSPIHQFRNSPIFFKKPPKGLPPSLAAPCQQSPQTPYDTLAPG
jgi:hypothetical protein